MKSVLFPVERYSPSGTHSTQVRYLIVQLRNQRTPVLSVELPPPWNGDLVPTPRTVVVPLAVALKNTILDFNDFKLRLHRVQSNSISRYRVSQFQELGVRFGRKQMERS